MPVDDWSTLMALAVNTLGGGIVGAIVALCCIKFESARDGFTRSVVSVIASGVGSYPTIWLIRWKWPEVKEEFALLFGVQFLWGMFGYYLLKWPLNEFEGTEKEKLSVVLKGAFKAFGPVFAKLGPWITKLGSKEDKS